MLWFVVLLAWLVILVCIWAIYQLIAQNGRLLLRVEALERHLGDLSGLSLGYGSGIGDDAVGPNDERHEGYEADEGAPPGLPPATVLHDFELPDLAGVQHLRSNWLGQRFLMIFVSPYCRSSRRLLADLANLRATPDPAWPSPVVVSTGSVDENRRLIERIGLTDTVLLQEEMEVGELFDVPATPMAYLVDEDGRTASPLLVGRAAILAIAARDTVDGSTLDLETPSEEFIQQATTPAPINGARYQGGQPVGSVAPSFDLPGLDGRRVALDQFRNRPFLLVFTDPIHPPCNEVGQFLARLPADPPPAIAMIARGSLEANRAWAERHSLKLPIGLQEHWDVSREYGLLAAPIGFYVNGRGAIEMPVAVGADAVIDLVEQAMGDAATAQRSGTRPGL